MSGGGSNRAHGSGEILLTKAGRRFWGGTIGRLRREFGAAVCLHFPNQAPQNTAAPPSGSLAVEKQRQSAGADMRTSDRLIADGQHLSGVAIFTELPFKLCRILRAVGVCDPDKRRAVGDKFAVFFHQCVQ